MRKELVLAAALAAGICLPAEAGRYEIRLEEQGEDRVLAVAREGGETIAVAAGRKALRLLPEREARAALERLRAGSGIAPPAPSPDDAAADRRIIIHRPDIEDDLSNDPSDREQSVIRKHVKAAAPADDDSPFAEADAPESAPAAPRAMIKRTEFEGADDKTAAAFIDAVAGLSATDKARLKALVGIAAPAPARKGFAVIRAGAEKPGGEN